MKTLCKNRHTEALQSKKRIRLMIILIGFAVFLTIFLISAAFPAASITAYWNFTEGAGTTATDEVGGLVLNVSNSWAAGIVNEAAVFDATHPNNNLSSHDGTAIDGMSGINGTDNSLSFWVYRTGATNSFLVSNRDDGSPTNDGTFYVQMNGGKIKVFDGWGGGAPTTNITTLNTWEHFVVTFNSTQITIYQNGTLSVIIPHPGGSAMNTTLPLHFFQYAGGTADGNTTDLRLDEIGWWSRTLTPDEVSDLWNAGAGEFYTGAAAGEIITTLNEPLDGTTISTVGTNFSGNYSATGGFNLTNATINVWYPNGTLFNETFQIIPNTNITSIYIDEFTLNNYDWNILACGDNVTTTICNWATNNYTLSVGAETNTEYYENRTLETSNQLFNATVTLFTGSTLYDAQVWFNGTYYDGTAINTGGNNYTVKTNIDMPLINNSESSQLRNWHWQLIYPLPDGSFLYQNLTDHEMNITEINLFTTNCNHGENTTLNFTAYREGNLTELDNYDFMGTFDYWLGSGSVKKNMSMSNSSVDHQVFCMYPNNETYYTNAKIQYEKSNFVKRSYYLINSSITNTTNDLRLYLLNSTFSTSFIISIINNVQIPITDAYIYIQRYYPGTGIFNTVEMARTDSSGNTIGHFEAETEDYKVIVFKDGQVLYESNMAKVFCGETPCTLTYQTAAGIPGIWKDIGNLTNLVWDLSYNEITKIWTYTYVDTSGTTNYGRLWVYTNIGRRRTTICNTTSNAPAATLTCDVTGYNGTITAEAYISRSPEVLVWLESIVESLTKLIFGMEGLFWATLILLVIGLVGLWSVAVGIIMMIAGIIAIGFLQIASFGMTTIMGIIIIGLILLWEMKK